MSDETTQSQTLQLNYIKSNYFRVIHADGAVANLGPGTLVLSLFSERAPIPQVQVFPVTAGDRLGDEVLDQRIARPGVVREVEVAITMNVEVARATRDLLSRQIENLEKAIAGLA